MTLEQKIKQDIRDIPDFPKPGIVFKDITPVLKNAELCKEMVEEIKNQVKDLNIEGVAGIESRGFLIGMPLALALDVPFILIRKKGKLPYKTVSYKYDLEYGSAEIEMHVDAVSKGQNILLHDDLLATGGSASAACELIEQQGANVKAINFLVELSFLNGRNAIHKYSKKITNLVAY
ncbi:MAG: adenine phosphoribosyltransferase [Putridiphycobacter sp.]